MDTAKFDTLQILNIYLFHTHSVKQRQTEPTAPDQTSTYYSLSGSSKTLLWHAVKWLMYLASSDITRA